MGFQKATLSHHHILSGKCLYYYFVLAAKIKTSNLILVIDHMPSQAQSINE